MRSTWTIVVALTLLPGVLSAEELMPRLERLVVTVKPETKAKLVRTRRAGQFRLTVKAYPKDIYRQLLRLTVDSGVLVRLLDRRKDRVVIGLTVEGAPGRGLGLGILTRPPRVALDVGPAEMVGKKVIDLEPPLGLLPVELGDVELPMPEVEYPRAPLLVPGAKEYNRARRLLRQEDPQGAVDSVTTYLEEHEKGQLVPYARYLRGEAMYQVAMRLTGAGAVQAADILREALDKSGSSPYAARGRLLLGRALVAAGRQEEAREAFSGGLGRRGKLMYSFRLGAAVAAAEAGDAVGARELLAPLWELDIRPEVGALARLVEAFLLYRDANCARLTPMLKTALRLDRVLGQHHPVAELMLAECLMEAGRTDEAGQLYDDLARREPEVSFLPAVRVRQGDILYRAGEMDAAINDWLSVMERFPASEARGLSRMRLALDPKTRPDVALAFLDEAIDAGGVTALEARYRKALFLLRNGDYDLAIRQATPLIDGPSDQYRSRARQVRDRAAYRAFAEDHKERRLQPIVERFLQTKRWLLKHPASLRIHRVVAAAFRDLGLPKRVVATLQTALGRFEGTAAEKGLLLDLADAFVVLQDGYRAGRIVGYLDTYVIRRAESLRLAVARAEAAAWTDRPLEAAKLFERAFRLAGTPEMRVHILARKGTVLAAIGEYAKGAKAFSRCVKHDPSTELIIPPHTPTADCAFGLGETLLHVGRWAEAGEALGLAADRHPEDRRRARARARAVLALRRAHRLEDAIEQFDKTSRERKEKERMEREAAGSKPEKPLELPQDDTILFWDRIAAEVADDTRWDLRQGPQYRELMREHE